MEYEFFDILNKQRPLHIDDRFAAKHPKMRRQDRAKIFAPFAALHGHSEQTHARERILSQRIELSEDSINTINFTLQNIEEQLETGKPVTARITHFVPEGSSGIYKNTEGKVENIDVVFGKLLIASRIIYFENIYNIEVKSK